jgi:hypothetical protein
MEADNKVCTDIFRNPEGTGQIFQTALSLLAKIHPVFATPRFAHWKKFAPVAVALRALTGPKPLFPIPLIGKLRHARPLPFCVESLA